jgi:hypothetical protein
MTSTLVCFALEGDQLAGYAVAESHPGGVNVLSLEGDANACRCLLARLVRLAGERDISCMVAMNRTEVHTVLRQQGFTCLGRSTFRGQPSYLFRLKR